MLTSTAMARNSTLPDIMREMPPLPSHLVGRAIVLVGLMGAGKTSIGRRLAGRLGLPFHDADAEIELAAGCDIAELFERFGESEFRAGERRVIRRLLTVGGPMVLATGGGAFMDPETRAAIRREATSVWLRCPLPTLVRRVSHRTHRPLLRHADPADVLAGLIAKRHPTYAEADIVVDCGEESADGTTSQVMRALLAWRPPRRLAVTLSSTQYDVVVGRDCWPAPAACWPPCCRRGASWWSPTASSPSCISRR